MDDPKVNQDTSPKGDSSEKTEGTSEPAEKTYTKESEKKAIDDALSAAGRDAKSSKDKADEAERLVTDARKIADVAKAESAKLQKARDDAEVEIAKDNPDALNALQEKRAHRNTKDELARVQRELDSEKGKLAEAEGKSAEYTKERNAREIAARLKVDYKPLLYTDGSTEAMETVGKALPKLEEKTVEGLKPDSGVTTGGALSDDKWLKEFGKTDSSIPPTKENLERAEQLTKNLKGNIV